MALTARVHRALSEIDPADWNALTADLDTPVFDWSWLNLLETAGGLDPDHGWTPLHLALWRGNAGGGPPPAPLRPLLTAYRPRPLRVCRLPVFSSR